MEKLYTALNEVDQLVIKNILEQTEFDLDMQSQTAVFEKKMKEVCYYFIFTKEQKIWEPLRFAYDTKLEPIQLFEIRSKDQKIICFKGARNLKQEEVSFVFTQMVRNASLFYFPEDMMALKLPEALEFLDRTMIDEQGNAWYALNAKEQMVMKLLFASGFLFEVKFDVDVLPHVEEILKLTTELAGKNADEITIADMKEVAFRDEFVKGVHQIFEIKDEK